MRPYVYLLLLLIVLAAPKRAMAESVHLCCNERTTCDRRILINYDTQIVTDIDDVGGKSMYRAEISDNAIRWQFKGGRNNAYTYYVTIDRFSLKLKGRRNDGVSHWELQCRVAPSPRRKI